MNIKTVGNAILNPKARIAFLTGAGISTSSGIPDFRSPGGMYDTLEPSLLTCSKKFKRLMDEDPTYVVSWEIFKITSLPYLEVRRPFILGINDVPSQWRPTISHYFARLLNDKDKLVRVYSQNIDGLDYNVGLPLEKLCSVHGTLGSFTCEGCNTSMDKSEFVEKLKSQIKDIYKTPETDYSAPETSTPILCPNCKRGLVKPATVLYGRNLPRDFYDKSLVDMPEEVNLLLVMGTSLTVHPAAGIPDMMELEEGEGKGGKEESNHKKLRVVINIEETVGSTSIDFNNNPNDIALCGGCDDICLDLIEECGWMEEFVLFKDGMCDESKRKIEERVGRGDGGEKKTD